MKSRSNMASSLNSRCSFYPCWRFFANWIQSKVEKSWMGLFGIKIWRLCGAISLLLFNKSRSNLASSLILKCFFYHYQRIFANWIQSKVEQIVDGSIWHQNLATLQSYIFVSFQQITFKLGIFTDFEVFVLSMLTDFCQLDPVKSWINSGWIYWHHLQR